MYGGELAIHQVLADLLWIDGAAQGRDRVTDELRAIGAWTESGVCGAFARMFGGRPAEHNVAAAFVYADIARANGYLVPGRRLSGDEFVNLRQDARGWTASDDRSPPELIESFGVPSLLRPGYNPSFPVSAGYVSDDDEDPLIVFDFWQPIFGSDLLGPEPVLRDVRWRAGRFEEGFTFSPLGATLLTRASS